MAGDVQAGKAKTRRRRRLSEAAAAEPSEPNSAVVLRAGHMLAPVEVLRHFPGNPRVADAPKIEASIRELGLYGAVVVQAATGHILAGNHVYDAAVAAGHTEIPTYVVDCDDATARRIVLADNRLASQARNDRYSLEALLAEVGQLPGFSAADIDAMLAEAVGSMLKAAPAAGVDAEDTEGAAIAEDAENEASNARLKIECGTERRQRSLVEHLTARKIPCKAVIG